MVTHLSNSFFIAFALASCVSLKAEQIRVLVIDDHVGMREGITAVINAQSDMTVVGEASNGQEAIERFAALKPDVTLLDWNLPIVHGEEALATLGKQFPEARFIVISALNSDDCIRRALALGAKSYLHKDMLRRELLPAIRAVREGLRYLPDAIAKRIEKEG